MGLMVRGLSASYRDTRAVADVDLDIASGQVVSIVGPNGCGKSTLLRAIARLHRPDAGQVLVDGADIWRLRPRAAAHRVALLPQSPQAPDAVTVAGLVRYGRHPHQGLLRQWSPADEAALADALRATGMLEFAGRMIDQLSGGQRQRSWLATTLAQQTPVLLLDEPTSALDLGHQVELLRLVRELARAGRTVVMVLHELTSAARHSDTLVAMRAGRVIAVGPPRAVVTADLVRELYDVAAHIMPAPDDGAPVVVPAAGTEAAETSGTALPGLAGARPGGETG